MSAVLAPALSPKATLASDLPPSPIEAARSALEGARHDLSVIDARIRGYQGELDQREVAQLAHRAATINAVAHGERVPKAPKLQSSDAEIALPILRGQRVKLEERVSECEGLLRRACVEEVERRYADALEAFAVASGALIEKWRDLVGAHALLEQSGVRTNVPPLSSALYSDFAIPVVGRLRAICANHWAHFIAEHAIAQGELTRAMHAARARVEGEIGMALPW